MDLKSFVNDFLNKFFKHVEKDNRIKSLWRIICQFVWFRDNNRHRSLKMRRPKSEIYICISDVDNVGDTFIISHQNLKITL